MTVAAEPMATGAWARTLETVRLRSAEPGDTDAVHGLIRAHVESGHLLPRTPAEIEAHLPRFRVAVDGPRVIGCAELTPLGPGVAEVRSLVVDERYRGRRIGTELIARLLDAAAAGPYRRVCAFTHDPRPFLRLGFSIVPHPWIPDKIATDCYRCTWFRRCSRYAVIRDIGNERPETRR